MSTPTCSAQQQAGITDGSSEKGERFCVDKCPYRKCILTRDKAVMLQAIRSNSQGRKL